MYEQLLRLCLLSLDLHLKLSLPQNYESNLHPLLVIVYVSLNTFSFLLQSKIISPHSLTLFVPSCRDGLPGSQSVTEEFALGWPQVLCSTQGVALAWVDGRSGVGRGQKTSALDPRKLGALRVKDYLGVVELVKLYMNKAKTQYFTQYFLSKFYFKHLFTLEMRHN